MAIDFPNSPTNGQRFTVGDKVWVYNGTSWDAETAYATYGHAASHNKAGSDPLTLDVAAPALATSGTQSSFKFDGDTYLNWSSDSTGAQWLIFDKSRGTLASKTSVVSNDELGRISFYGYSSDGTSHEAAWISSRAVETPTAVGSSNEIPSTIRFGIFDNQGTAWEPLTLTRETNYPLTNTFGIVRMGSYNNSGYVEYGISGSLNVRGTSDADLLVLTRYSTTGPAALTLRRSDTDTLDVGGIVDSGDGLGNIYFSGWNGSAYNDGAGIRVFAEENWSTTNEGTNLRFYTTPLGSTTLTERMRISADGLITGSGSSLGSWVLASPGTVFGVTIGNGTHEQWQCKIGKILFCRGRITLGSTSSITGNIQIPVANSTMTATPTSPSAVIGNAIFWDSSASARYFSALIQDGTSYVSTKVSGTNGLLANVSATLPFTWAVGDYIEYSFIVELQ